MKKRYLTTALMICLTAFYGGLKAQENNKNYDEKLAKELNADEYGMKVYVLAILKTGIEKSFSKAKQDSVFKGHMTNIGKLVTDGKLVVAGPLGKNDKNYRGIFILDVPTIEEAKKLVDTDPAIQSKLLDVDLIIWYGSAALKETLKIHSKIEKRSH
ncbi:YciI family protein [Pedobacter caeni]|uniref:YCII-related domain-containing protein n=1 Tax=Pedobacter caeni TaxID=288992 RepID=A0A1M5IWW4_9SPHI|nr:YciI family protein [Pedobacter caeni]SHG32786.1 YCII-related domain-containing protein [Pedobacter caeni]